MPDYELKLWEHPNCYIGQEWYGYYVGLGQTRDSEPLERSNFRVFLRELGGESDTVEVVRERHWACGWIEWIAIDQTDTVSVDKARSLFNRLNQYPVLDEEDWSNEESEEAQSIWYSISLREKIKYCKQAKISIFSARQKYYPYECEQYLIG